MRQLTRQLKPLLSVILSVLLLAQPGFAASGINKTAGTSVLALQSIATATTVISSAIDVSTKLAATLFIHWGRRSATALTKSLTVRVEGSATASGNNNWFPIAQYASLIAAVNLEAVSGTAAAGQAVILMASTTGFNVGDVVFCDNTTIANSEWGRIITVTTNTSITLEDNLTFAQTGSTVYPSGAAVYPTDEGIISAMIDLTAITRLRVVAGSQTAQAMAIEVLMVTGDTVQ